MLQRNDGGDRMSEDLVIRVTIQRGMGGPGPMVGKIGKRGHAIWPVVGDGDTIEYCKQMAEDLGIEYEGVFDWQGRQIESTTPP